MNLWLVFLTGLTTGGLTCLALQGGLLATAIAAQRGNTSNQPSFKEAFMPTLIFMIAKLVAYTIIGFLLGIIGSLFELSILTQILIQFAVGIFMIVTALRMLDVHPVFRRFVLTPPKSVFKFMRTKAKSGAYFSPLILGLATVFLPCGTTQAMEIQALGTGNPFYGAATMFVFTLGTAPVFFLIGTLAATLRQSFEKYVYPVAAGLILILGVMAIDNGLSLAGSPMTLKSALANFWQTATGASLSSREQTATVSGKTQTATITVYATGYEPQKMTVAAGMPTKLSFVTKNTQGCSRALVFPTLKIQKILPESGVTEVDLPALSKGDRIPYSCSMGMFTGTIIAT